MSSRQRTKRVALVTLGVLTLSGGLTLHRNWRDVDRYLARQRRYLHFSNGPDGLYKDLYGGRIKAGDSVDELIATHPPKDVIRTDRYTVVLYGGCFEGVTVVAKDGRLASAAIGSCTFGDVFFNTLTPDEEATVYAAFEAERDRQLEARKAAELAVAGFGATFEPWNLPQPGPEN